MKRFAMMTLTIMACSGASGDDTADGGGSAADGDSCQAYAACELTSEEDFAAAIGSTTAPHEKPQGNTKQIYHCAIDSNGDDPFADVSINCRTDGRSHEQYLLAHDTAAQLDGFQDITDLGHPAFWISNAPGTGSLEVEADDHDVVIVMVYAVPGGMELSGSRRLAQTVLDRLR